MKLIERFRMLQKYTQSRSQNTSSCSQWLKFHSQCAHHNAFAFLQQCEEFVPYERITTFHVEFTTNHDMHMGGGGGGGGGGVLTDNNDFLC